jgi:hypothetical protein
MRASAIFATLAIAFGPAGGALGQDLNLFLRCEGIASTLEDNSTTLATVTTNHGDRAHVTVGGVSSQTSPERIRLEITGGNARIQLPGRILPPIRGGASADGWWTITDLVVGETHITGRFRLNVFNKPTLRIDRVSGDIDIQAMMKTGFQGTCAPEDRSPANRKF